MLNALLAMLGVHATTVANIDMERKSNTQIWLIDKSPPIFHSIGPHGFISAFPPTTEEVLLQIWAYRGLPNLFAKRFPSTIQTAVSPTASQARLGGMVDKDGYYY